MNSNPSYQGSAFFSYGFRPFFFCTALFAAIAVPAWVMILFEGVGVGWHHLSRQWHVHEMVFGFLPGVITGFLLTAIPNWTGNQPVKGIPLIGLLGLWVAGRVVMAFWWVSDLIAGIVDGAFLVVMSAIIWREIVVGRVWDRLPMGVLISLYAMANLLFHARHLHGTTTDLAERMALAVLMILLTLIGGRIAPGFTEDFFEEAGLPQKPAPFSYFDGMSVVLVASAGLSWTIAPEAMLTGWLLVVGGVMNVSRLARWYGWLAWREPLVLVLHVGYGWLAMSLLALGGAILEIGLHREEALHVLTTGAVGVMTLAVMTRASLGHTGRTKHAGPLTVIIYLLANLGALLRVFGPLIHLPGNLLLGLAAICWSGAYLLFAAGYGPFLFGPSTDES